MRCAPLHPHLSSQGHTQLECLDAFVVIDWVSAETERKHTLIVQGGCLRMEQTKALLRGSLNANHRPRRCGKAFCVTQVILQKTGRPWSVSDVTGNIEPSANETRKKHKTNQVPRTPSQSLRVHHQLQRTLSSKCLERARRQLTRSKNSEGKETGDSKV